MFDVLKMSFSFAIEKRSLESLLANTYRYIHDNSRTGPGMAHFNPSSESCVPYIKAGMPFLMGEPTSAVKGSKNTVDWKYNE